MSLDRKRLNIRQLIETILEINPNIKDATARQQAYVTTLVALIIGTVSLLAALIAVIVGLRPALDISLFIIAIVMAIACALSRSENYQAGSIFLVSGTILGGFLLSTGFPGGSVGIFILLATVVPALSLSIILLPVTVIIIISVVTLISLGILPLMAITTVSTGLLLFVSLIIIEAVAILTAWFRESLENRQVEELSSLRLRLEERVEERIRYTRIAADIAQEIIGAASMEELLNRTASLITSRLGFVYTGIYMVHENERYAALRAAQGPQAEKLVQSGKRVNFGPPALLGWVAENQQQRIVARGVEDPLLLEADLLPESQSEIGIPVSSRDEMLAILDVQSTRSTAFDNETIVILQMLANEIATAIQNVRQIENSQASIQEVTAVYVAGAGIAQAKTEEDINRAVQELFSKTSYVSMLLKPEGSGFKISVKSDIPAPGEQPLPDSIAVAREELESFATTDIFMGEGSRLNLLPYDLLKVLRQLEIFSVAIVPVIAQKTIAAILLIGTRERVPLNTNDIEPYADLAKQIATSLDRIIERRQIEEHIVEIESLNSQLQTVSGTADKVANSPTYDDVFKITKQVFQHSPYVGILLLAEKNNFRMIPRTDQAQPDEEVKLPELLDVSPEDVLKQLGNRTVIAETGKLSAAYHAQFHPEWAEFIKEEANKLPVLPPPLLQIIEQPQFINTAFIPVLRNGALVTLLILGTTKEQPISPETAQTYANVAELFTSTIERIQKNQKTERRIMEMEAITTVSQEISTIRDLQVLYGTLHTHIRQTLGDVSFLVALYDPSTDSISVPYMFEQGLAGGEITKVEAFPLGEGLTSILVRTKQPLMLVEDVEKRAEELGAKTSGTGAKSWLGTPLVVADEVIGAMVVQDIEHESAFDENDLRFLTTLSSQVAGTIYNARLLDETRSRALQLQTAAEIARDISGSLDLNELLSKAVTLIRERFNFYHAAVFLIDATSEYASVREATGEAGMEMKRAGHKLKVGSKSIVGYVTGSGEPLIVNDTSRDATYFANPLLPETRAEVALPLRVGPRILGALDVQSTQPYSFGEEDISVLRILADQLAIAVINSELFADTQEHLSQHRLLHHVTTAAASGTTLEEALKSAVQGLQVTLGGDRVAILLAQKERKVLKIESFAGYSEEVGQLEIAFGEGITGWVAVHQQPQRVSDVSKDSRYIQVGSNVRSELAVPLSYRGELLGVLNVESDQVAAYDENDEEMLGTLGGSLAAVISNARLIEQVRRQVDRERMLYEVTSKIRRSTDMKTIMATTTSELSKALGARRAQIKIDVSSEPNPVEPK